MNRRSRQQLFAANDPLLHPLLDADGDAERQRVIESVVVGHANPIIATILQRSRNESLSEEELDDIAATVALRLVRRLQSVSLSRDGAIRNLSEYISRLTNNAIYDALRKRFPQRTRLKNRLRYTLTNDARFVTWLSNGVTVAGLSSWTTREGARAPFLAKQRITDDMLDARDPGRAIEALLREAGKPITLDDLIRIFGDLWHVVDVRSAPLQEQEAASTPLRDLEMRQRLGNLWEEIRQLPARQRIALLLNLRESESFSAVSLFVLVGTTTFGDIAACLEMTQDELTELWNELPIDDLTIAKRLGVTRQQVINLRKSARERLSRRMNKKERWGTGMSPDRLES